MFNLFRKIGFQLVDVFTGGKIATYKKEIAYSLDGIIPNVKGLQQKRITDLLDHAVDHVSFYKNHKKYSTINDFLVVNKNMIKTNFNDFQSDIYLQKNNKVIKTSGSTGAPFKVYHNKDKRSRNTADVLFFAEKVGYKIGDPIVYVKIWAEPTKKQKISFWINNQIPFGINDLSDAKISELIKKLNNNYKSIYFIGYVSAIESICSYIERKRVVLKFKVISVTTMSESLDTRTRRYIEKVLKTKVYARYSNNENGIIAQQVDETNKYLINFASYYVEILNFNTNLPVKEGNPGRIVVTDLFNYAMPLIRYDTGDVGALQTINDIPYFSRIEGRKMDMIFDTKGEIVSSFIVSQLMWEYMDLKQYQFIQEGKNDYLILLNINKDFKNEQKIVSDFMSVLGNDSNIKIEYIDEIPLLDSGKRKRVKNIMLK